MRAPGYHCKHYHSGQCPRDAILGATVVSLSRGASASVSPGALSGFAETASDGGAGIEDWLRLNFPQVEAVILDFYHAAEYVGEWAKVLHADATAAKRVASEWCRRLKREGGEAVLSGVRRTDVTSRGVVVQDADRVLVYFGNQVHRMDYPSYRSKGRLIGSDPVERACKQVVGQRMKGSGMRWGETGAEAICHPRALFRSEKG